MNICVSNKNTRVARQKFWVMGGDQGSHGGGHRIFGMGGDSLSWGGTRSGWGGVQGHPGALWEPLSNLSSVS